MFLFTFFSHDISGRWQMKISTKALHVRSVIRKAFGQPEFYLLFSRKCHVCIFIQGNNLRNVPEFNRIHKCRFWGNCDIASWDSFGQPLILEVDSTRSPVTELGLKNSWIRNMNEVGPTVHVVSRANTTIDMQTDRHASFQMLLFHIQKYLDPRDWFFFWITILSSSGRAVGIGTVFGLDDRGLAVRVSVGSRIFASPYRPDRLWGSSSLLSKGHRGLFPWDKAAGAWIWPLTSK
jgi:hypothetical protein